MANLDSLGLSKSMADVFKCKICTKVTFIAFLSIIIIELIVLVPSCEKFVKDWENNKSLRVLSAIKTVILLKPSVSDPLELSHLISQLKEVENILGWKVTRLSDQNTAAGGDKLPDFAQQQSTATFVSIFQNRKYFDVSWDASVLSIPYEISLRIDSNELRPAILGYVFRITGLVVIISVFVTAAVMLALKSIIFSPILTLRNHLNAAQADLHHADMYIIDHNDTGEIGELYTGFNSLLLQIIKDYKKIENFNFSLKKEIQERHEIEKKLIDSKEILETQASYDDLTGLPNRRVALAKLACEMEYSIENSISGAILFVDLDNFKEINDTLGHSSGDEMLVQASTAMVSLVRSSRASVNGDHFELVCTSKEKRKSSHDRIDLVARIGGDEFMIILCDISANEVENITKRIQNFFTRPFVLTGGEAFSTTSIGVSIFPKDSQIPNECMSHADLALYDAKEAGRNCYRFFSADMVKDKHYRSKVIRQLHYALDNDEFSLNYQPIVDLKTNKMVSVEVLLRWDNAELGYVSPEAFIPIAESCGLMSPIGNWVMTTAFEKCKELNAQGGPTRVAINVSPKQFKDKNIVPFIRLLLEKYEISASLIDLEITENLLIGEKSEEAKNIHVLSQLGINFSIDDFGTGYSSLSYLRRFPVNTLKIDRAFVNEITNSEKDIPLIRTIIGMGKNFKLKIIAEGVENKKQVDFLVAQGCDYAQGYYFSKPVVFKQLLRLLNK